MLPCYGVEPISEPYQKLLLDEMARHAYSTTIAEFSAKNATSA